MRTASSAHAAVRCGADQRKELERLCRYITRPAIANERLNRNHAGDVVLQLKSAYQWHPGRICALGRNPTRTRELEAKTTTQRRPNGALR
jgi:hypothetical protein